MRGATSSDLMVWSGSAWAILFVRAGAGGRSHHAVQGLAEAQARQQGARPMQCRLARPPGRAAAQRCSPDPGGQRRNALVASAPGRLHEPVLRGCPEARRAPGPAVQQLAARVRDLPGELVGAGAVRGRGRRQHPQDAVPCAPGHAARVNGSAGLRTARLPG
jgi:hypothetical protein